MKNSKTNLMFLLPVAPLAIFIVDYFMATFPNITFYNCILATAALGIVLYLSIFILCLNLGNLAKMLYLKIKGYSLFPLYIYPLYAYRNAEGKAKLKVVFEWTTFFRNLFSYDLILEYDCAPKKIESICANAIRINFYTKIIGLVGLGFVSYRLFPDVFVLIVYIAFVLMFCWLANINTDYFHGEAIRIQNVKKGDFILYLAKEICIYEIAYSEKKKIYDRFDKWLMKSECLSDKKNLVASVLKHMCIEGYACHQDFLTEEMRKIMKENILSDKTIAFGMFSETWELAKAYLAYSLLSQDSDEVSYVVKELQKIRIEVSLYLIRFNDMINWYINIAHCNLTEKEKYKYPLFLKKDRFSMIALTYKKQVEIMEKKLLSIVINE